MAQPFDQVVTAALPFKQRSAADGIANLRKVTT